MLNRVLIRKPDIDNDIAEELIRTAKDRIKLRVGYYEDAFPSELESIVVEVVCAMYNRMQLNQEGVDSERVDVFSVKFIANLLDEYKDELEAFKYKVHEEELEVSGHAKLRFL